MFTSLDHVKTECDWTLTTSRILFYPFNIQTHSHSDTYLLSVYCVPCTDLGTAVNRQTQIPAPGELWSVWGWGRKTDGKINKGLSLKPGEALCTHRGTANGRQAQVPQAPCVSLG